MSYQPGRIVLRVLSGGCYTLCGFGIAAVVVGQFVLPLNVATSIALLATSLFCGSIGLILQLIAASLS